MHAIAKHADGGWAQVPGDFLTPTALEHAVLERHEHAMRSREAIQSAFIQLGGKTRIHQGGSYILLGECVAHPLAQAKEAAKRQHCDITASADRLVARLVKAHREPRAIGVRGVARLAASCDRLACLPVKDLLANSATRFRGARGDAGVDNSVSQQLRTRDHAVTGYANHHGALVLRKRPIQHGLVLLATHRRQAAQIGQRSLQGKVEKAQVRGISGAEHRRTEVQNDCGQAVEAQIVPEFIVCALHKHAVEPNTGLAPARARPAA